MDILKGLMPGGGSTTSSSNENTATKEAERGTPKMLPDRIGRGGLKIEKNQILIGMTSGAGTKPIANPSITITPPLHSNTANHSATNTPTLITKNSDEDRPASAHLQNIKKLRRTFSNDRFKDMVANEDKKAK